MKRDVYRMRTRQEFEAWLRAIDARLAWFHHEVPASLRPYLDFTISSLNILESWLLDRYPNLDLAMTPDEYALVEAAGTYVGETLRKLVGGEWTIELDDWEAAYLGVPGLEGFESRTVKNPAYPHSWVTASLHRRTGHYIRDRFEHIMRE